MEQTLSVLVFRNAGWTADSGQICHVAGLLVGPLKPNSVFHDISWSSHKARLPAKSIGAAETLAARAPIDIERSLKSI